MKCFRWCSIITELALVNVIEMMKVKIVKEFKWDSSEKICKSFRWQKLQCKLLMSEKTNAEWKVTWDV